MIKVIRTYNDRTTTTIIHNSLAHASDTLRRFRKNALLDGFILESEKYDCDYLISFTVTCGDDCLSMRIEELTESESQSIERIYRAFASDELGGETS